MNPKPDILSSTEMLAKYHESGIEDKLNDFKKIEDFDEICNRRTEVYKDQLTRKKVLARHFLNNEGGRMTVTYLRYNNLWCSADRIS